MKLSPAMFALLAAACMSSAQVQPGPRFEVASVKWSGSERDASNDIMRGGPGTSESQRIAWRQPLTRLIAVGYGLDFDQISGPGWFATERYSLDATLPPGTTKEEFALMLRELLAERFHLKTHTVRKDFPAYELTVSKVGPKLREAGAPDPRPLAGFPELGPGKKFGYQMVMPRNVRITFRDCSMAELAQRLGWPLAEFASVGGVAMGRVLDHTGLKGRYDFNLEYAGAWGPAGAFARPRFEGDLDTAPLFFDALRQQLGLELRESKAPQDVLVIDQIDKIPTEN